MLKSTSQYIQAVQPSYEIIFCGMGVSTCLILREMNRRGLLVDCSILVIEPQETHSPKTLCFWAKPTDDIVLNNQDLIQHVWTYAQVPPGQPEMIGLEQYYQINSQDLFDSVMSLCQEHCIDVLHASVQDVIGQTDCLEVLTSLGKVDGHRVFDGRHSPDADAPGEARLLQSFFGLFVEVSEATFQKDCMTLMDFEVPQDGATQFMYVLPENPHRALVECTRFGVETINIDAAREYIHEYVMTRWGKYTVVDSEQGVIPMAFPTNVSTGVNNYVQIGTRGGAVKPSTGYAFQTMFEHAQNICRDFSSDVEVQMPKRFQFYDRLLLDILVRDGELGKPIFLQLFANHSISMVFKFLKQQTTIWEDAKIFYRLPWGPFLLAACRELRSLLTNRPDVSLLFGTTLFALLYQIFPTFIYSIGIGLAFVSLFAVGIPHGALDYLTLAKGGVSRWNPKFHLIYWSLILMMAGLWYLTPVWGLLIFVVTSAWHFGQTDFEHWSIHKHPVFTMLWGVSVLAWIIGTHPYESATVMELLGVPLWDMGVEAVILLMPVVILQIGLLYWMKSKRMMVSLGTILIASLLPLPLAFGMYFLGQHSVQAWSHLQKTTGTAEFDLWLEALPFTFGALMLCIAFMVFPRMQDFQFEWLIIVASCITFPHIVYMDSFYRRGGVKSGYTT